MCPGGDEGTLTHKRGRGKEGPKKEQEGQGGGGGENGPTAGGGGGAVYSESECKRGKPPSRASRSAGPPFLPPRPPAAGAKGPPARFEWAARPPSLVKTGFFRLPRKEAGSGPGKKE